MQNKKILDKNKQLEGLKQFLRSHLAIGNVAISIAENTYIRIKTQEITKECSIFYLKDSNEVKKLYIICYILGELPLKVIVPRVSRGVTYTIFEIGSLELKQKEDQDIITFVHKLGNAVKIGNNSH